MDIISRHTVSWKNWTKDHRVKDQGSVQNESNKLNKLIGMIDCSFTWLSQDLPYAKTKIRENTKYWKSHTTLWKCQFSPTDYELILNPWSLILDPWSGDPWSSIFRKPPTNWPSEGVYLLIDYLTWIGRGVRDFGCVIMEFSSSIIGFTTPPLLYWQFVGSQFSIVSPPPPLNTLFATTDPLRYPWKPLDPPKFSPPSDSKSDWPLLNSRWLQIFHLLRQFGELRSFHFAPHEYIYLRG